MIVLLPAIICPEWRLTYGFGRNRVAIINGVLPMLGPECNYGWYIHYCFFDRLIFHCPRFTLFAIGLKPPVGIHVCQKKSWAINPSK